MRPTELAREHGLSTQAVRNYEARGVLPAAARTPSGYRSYTAAHAAALRAFLALIPACGHARAGEIMRAANEGELDRALALVDQSHDQLAQDRATLDAVRRATGALTATPRHDPPSGLPWTIGELAARLRLTPATLRNWERAAILAPPRDRSGQRRYEADDVRDAELAHLLRRGGYPLGHIATVVRQVRQAGGTTELMDALAGWQQRLTSRGLAMLRAAGLLASYLDLAPSTQ